MVDGIEEPRSLALVNGVPAVALDLQKQSGANTVSAVELVKKEIARLQPELPPGTRIEVVRDASIMIRDSVEDVQTTLILDGLPLGEAMNKVKAVADTMPMAPGYRKVGVSQPLYSSGAVAAGIRAAGKGLATADDRLRIARHAVLRDVYSAFHDILLGRELNRIATEDRAQKARHLDEARKKYAAGTATDYDILAAEVALRNTEPAVVRTENSIRTVRERLRFLLGRDRSEVDAKGDLSAVVVEPPEYGKSLKTAVEHRPELSDLRHRQGVAQELLVIARTGNRPRLDFRGALGRQEIDFGVDDIGGKTWSAGVFATWPLFDGLRTR